MYLVDLVGMFGVDAIPPELKGFVDFQAKLENRSLTGQEQVALLVVRNTESYIAVFMDDLEGLDELDARLLRQESKLSEETRTAMLQAIKDRGVKGP